MISISKSDMAELLKGIRADVVAHLLMERRDELQLLTPSQVCGILDVTPRTLEISLKIPRVTLIAGSAVRYRASDVAKFIESRRA